MRQTIKNIFKIAFTVLFFWFSCETLQAFYTGKITYEILKEKNESLHFPSLTICPSQAGALAPLNVLKLKEYLPDDLNKFNPADQSVFVLLQNISNPIEIVKNFSFSETEAQISGTLV